MFFEYVEIFNGGKVLGVIGKGGKTGRERAQEDVLCQFKTALRAPIKLHVVGRYSAECWKPRPQGDFPFLLLRTTGQHPEIY